MFELKRWRFDFKRFAKKNLLKTIFFQILKVTIDLLASDWFWSLPFPFVGFPIFVSRDRLKRKTEKKIDFLKSPSAYFCQIVLDHFFSNSVAVLNAMKKKARQFFIGSRLVLVP